jgi:hypothetical protein
MLYSLYLCSFSLRVSDVTHGIDDFSLFRCMAVVEVFVFAGAAATFLTSRSLWLFVVGVSVKLFC